MALTPGKARKMLEDGTVHGRGLTDKQKKYFGAIAGGATPVKAINGGWLDKYAMGGSLPGASGMMYARSNTPPPLYTQSEMKAKSGGRCWSGYKAVAGKTPFSKGSCKKAQDGDKTQATISQYEEPAWYDKVVDYLASPMTAFGYSARNQDLPDSIPINAENRNAFDSIIDTINPFAWAKYAASADRNLDEGEYLDAGFDALGAIPIVPAWLARGKTAAIKNTVANFTKNIVPNLTNPLSDTRVGLTEALGLIKGGKFKSKYKGFNESGVNAASDFGKTWQKAPGFQTRFDDFTYQVNDPALTRQVRNNQNLYNQGLEKLKAKQPDLFTPNGELTVPLSTIQKMFPRLADDAMLLKRLNDQIVEGASKINYANNARMNADQIGATGRFTKVMKPTSADDISYFADNPNTLGFFRASENRALIDIDRFESNYRNLSKRNWKLSRTVAHENKHAMDAGARATRPEYARTIQSAVPQVTDDYTKVLTGANKKDIKKVYGNIKNLGDDTAESIEYLSRPQEVAARVDELRMEYIPKKFWGTDKQYEVSDDLINKIISEGKAGKTSVDVRFFKMIKDKEAFKNLFKVLPAVAAPVAIGTAQQKNGGWLSKYENGGVIEDDRGQWAHPGEVTKINSNNITMKGVDFPVLGISDTGDKKMMQPGKDYKFDGNSVTEYPMAQEGETVDVSEQIDFLKNWNMSNRGQELLSNSFDGKEKLITDRTNRRNNFLDTVSVEQADGGDDYLGRYNPGRHRIRLDNSLFDGDFKFVGKGLKDVALHELSHSQDYGGGTTSFNKLNMPLSDVKLINSLNKSNIKNIKKNKDLSKSDVSELKYIGDPTEVRARLNAIRYFYENTGLKEEGMPSIFDSEITPEMQDIMKTNDQYRDLKKLYSDDEIKMLLNTISDNSQSSAPSNMAYAKQGESLVALDQLTNFTNYNTPQPGGWLDKY